jgi:hypothetical protein
MKHNCKAGATPKAFDQAHTGASEKCSMLSSRPFQAQRSFDAIIMPLATEKNHAIFPPNDVSHACSPENARLDNANAATSALTEMPHFFPASTIPSNKKPASR